MQKKIGKFTDAAKVLLDELSKKHPDAALIVKEWMHLLSDNKQSEADAKLGKLPKLTEAPSSLLCVLGELFELAREWGINLPR